MWRRLKRRTSPLDFWADIYSVASRYTAQPNTIRANMIPRFLKRISFGGSREPLLGTDIPPEVSIIVLEIRIYIGVPVQKIRSSSGSNGGTNSLSPGYILVSRSHWDEHGTWDFAIVELL
jgi:hypothetical protein